MIPITDDEYKKVLYHIRTVLLILHYDIKLTKYTWLPPHLGCLLFIRKISKAGSAKSNKIRSLGDRNYQHKYCSDIVSLWKYHIGAIPYQQELA